MILQIDCHGNISNSELCDTNLREPTYRYLFVSKIYVPKIMEQCVCIVNSHVPAAVFICLVYDRRNVTQKRGIKTTHCS